MLEDSYVNAKDLALKAVIATARDINYYFGEADDQINKDGNRRKLNEEVNELRLALDSGGNIADEIGDVVIVLARMAALHGIDFEQALLDASTKVDKRLDYMKYVAGEDLEILTPNERLQLFKSAKRFES